MSSLEADVAANPQAPAPVITFEAFQALCTASALQVSAALVSEEQLNTFSRQGGRTINDRAALAAKTVLQESDRVFRLLCHREQTPDRAGCLLQHPGVRLNPPTFSPLGPDETPKAGTLLAIDTEFVAHSPPDKVFKG